MFIIARFMCTVSSAVLKKFQLKEIFISWNIPKFSDSYWYTPEEDGSEINI